MTRDITLGQYYPMDSVLHKMDPRMKLSGAMALIISLFLTNNIWAYAMATLLLAMAIKLSGVSFRFMMKGLKATMFLLLISVSFNLFLTNEEVLVKLGFLKITRESIRMAYFMGLRLMYLVMDSSTMMLTTTLNELTDGPEKSLGFLKETKAPVHGVSTMIPIALQFIPILIKGTDKIMKTQMVKGAGFGSGNLIQEAKGMVPLPVLLFTSTFYRVTGLAITMEARCYRGGEGRTKMKPLKYARRDGMTCLVYVGCLAVMIGITRFLQKEGLDETGGNGGRL